MGDWKGRRLRKTWQEYDLACTRLRSLDFDLFGRVWYHRGSIPNYAFPCLQFNVQRLSFDSSLSVNNADEAKSALSKMISKGSWKVLLAYVIFPTCIDVNLHLLKQEFRRLSRFASFASYLWKNQNDKKQTSGGLGRYSKEYWPWLLPAAIWTDLQACLLMGPSSSLDPLASQLAQSPIQSIHAWVGKFEQWYTFSMQWSIIHFALEDTPIAFT